MNDLYRIFVFLIFPMLLGYAFFCEYTEVQALICKDTKGSVTYVSTEKPVWAEKYSINLGDCKSYTMSKSEYFNLIRRFK